MRKILATAIAIIVTATVYSACEKKGPIQSAGAWVVGGTDAVVVFLFVSGEPDQPPEETVLREKSLSVGRIWSEKYSEVHVYTFYDENTAKELAEPESLEEAAKSSATIDENLLYQGEPMGGSYMTLSSGRETQWFYLPRGGM